MHYLLIVLINFEGHIHKVQEIRRSNQIILQHDDSPVLVHYRCHAINDGRALAVGKFGETRDVGRTAKHGLVTRYQHAILGGHEIRLNDVGPERNGESIRLKRVLRQISGRATMTNHQRCLTVERVPGDGLRHNAAQRDSGCDGDGEQ